MKSSPAFPFPKLIRKFIEMESASGVAMLVAAACALIVANSPWAEGYKTFITTPLSFGLGERVATEPLYVWVKDIIMVLFFFLIGLELKREATEGFLSQRDQMLLPAIAALGGMVAPAALFMLMNLNHPEHHAGWAISSATDIAFALCILMLVAKNIPPAAKIFLLAVAIVDDLGAILIIALFYAGELAVTPLLLAALGVAALFFLNRLRVSILMPYIVIGIYLWFCLYHGGIHTTLAGVLTALFIPMRAEQDDADSHSPINQTIHFLHPWVGFVILPLFAFTSAGINLQGITPESLLQPLPLGIALSLFIGKQIGVFGATFATIKLGIARKPEGTSWLQLYGISVLAGIGFTMSLFIGALALPYALQDSVKLGVIMGSLLSTLWGAVILRLALAKQG